MSVQGVTTEREESGRMFSLRAKIKTRGEHEMDDQLRQKIDTVADEMYKIIYHGEKGVALETALRNAGVDVRFFAEDDDKGVSSYLTWNSKKDMPVIMVNALESRESQRFSIARELGHLVLGFRWLPFPYSTKSLFNEDKVLNVTKYRGTKKLTKTEQLEENKIDEFAIAFLLPDSELAKIIDLTNLTTGVIGEVAKKLDVSPQTANLRVKIYIKSKGKK